MTENRMDSALRDVRIAGLKLENFKCFKQSVHLRGLSDFSCIVGPNGTGKSVLGEAIAFALGGSRKMLRASSLASLIHEDVLKARGSAKVVLHVAARSNDGKTQHLRIQRTLESNGSSRTSVAQTDGSRTQATAPTWRGVTQEELRRTLLPWGIDTAVVDRYVVTQARQAVGACSDPVGLVSHLELLLGTADLADQITGLERQLDSVCSTAAQLDEQQRSLEEQRAALAPAVAAERQYHEDTRALQRRKRKLYAASCEWLTWALRQAEKTEASCVERAGRADKETDATAAQLTAARRRRTECSKGLESASKHAQSLQTQAEKTQCEAARLKSRLAGARRTVITTTKQKQTYEADLSAAEKNANESDAAAKAASTVLESATQEVARVRADLRKAQKAATAAAENGGPLGRAHRLVQEASDQLSHLQGQVDSAEASVKEQTGARQRAQQALEAHTAKVVKAREELTRQHMIVEAAAERVREQRAALTQAQTELSTAEQAHIEAQVQVHVTNARVQDTANQARALSAPHTPAPPDTPQQAVSNGRATAHVSTNRQSNDPVEVLWQQSRPGTFYGRLCNALALTDALAGTAVNAALGLLCNMGSTVVVSDRQTALGVVRYYADNRIGMVTCKVLDELRTNTRAAQDEQRTVHSVANRLNLPVTPLSHLVRPHTQHTAASNTLTTLAASLLDGWYLVDTTQAAQALIAEQARSEATAGSAPRGHAGSSAGGGGGRIDNGLSVMPGVNIVTRAGQVFKADGELVGRQGMGGGGPSGAQSGAAAQHRGAAPFGPYDLRTDGRVLGGAGSSATQLQSDAATPAVHGGAGPAPGPAHRQQRGKPPLPTRPPRTAAGGPSTHAADDAAATAAAAAAAREAAEQEQRAAAAQLAAANTACVAAMEVVTAKRGVVQECEGRVREAEGVLVRGQRAHSQATQTLQRMETALRRVQTESAAAIAKADASTQRLTTELSILRGQVRAAAERLAHAEAQLREEQTHAGQETDKGPSAAQRVAELEKQLCEARTQHAKAKEHHTTCQEALRSVTMRVSALRAQLQQVSAALAAATTETEVCRVAQAKHTEQEMTLKEQIAVAKQRVSEAEKDLAAATAEVSRLEDLHSTCQTEVTDARTALQAARAKKASLAAELETTRAVYATLAPAADAPNPSHTHTRTEQQTGVPPATPGAAGIFVGISGGGIVGTERGAKGCVESKSTAARQSSRRSRASRSAQRRRQRVVASSDSSLSSDTTSTSSDKTDTGSCEGDDSEASEAGSDTRAKLLRRPGRTPSQRGSTQRVSKAPATQTADSDDSDGPHDTPVSKRPRRAQQASARGTARKAASDKVKAQSRGKGTAKGAGKGTKAADGEPCSEKWLREERVWVQDRETELESVKSSVKFGSIEEDVRLSSELSAVADSARAVQCTRQELQTKVEALIDRRYAAVADTLAVVNTHLSRIYWFLTGNLGDAYCSYTLERRLLFAQGVALVVRPDQHRWRAFHALSGGQQALASLSLSFALQAALPSPFYVLDEADAALDTLAASRVADYLSRGGVLPEGPIKWTPVPRTSTMAPEGGDHEDVPDTAREQGGAIARVAPADCGAAAPRVQRAQYLVITHRPQMLEKAGCLIGVYTSPTPGASHAVAVQFKGPLPSSKEG